MNFFSDTSSWCETGHPSYKSHHERTLTTVSLIGKPPQNDPTDIEALAKKSNSDYFAGMNRL